MFKNYPEIFENFCSGSLLRSENVKSIIQSALEATPSLFKLAIKGFFEKIAEKGNKALLSLIEKCIHFKQNFYQKNPHISPEKSLEKQFDIKKFSEIGTEYMELFSSKDLEFSLEKIQQFTFIFQLFFSEFLTKITYKMHKINKKRKLAMKSINRLEKEKTEITTSLLSQQQQIQQ